MTENIAPVAVSGERQIRIAPGDMAFYTVQDTVGSPLIRLCFLLQAIMPNGIAVGTVFTLPGMKQKHPRSGLPMDAPSSFHITAPFDPSGKPNTWAPREIIIPIDEARMAEAQRQQVEAEAAEVDPAGGLRVVGE